MPHSDLWNVPVVLNWIRESNPESVLDIGVGFGKYGLLCREILEVGHSRYHKEEWKVRVEGIEIFPKYHTPVWDYAYDKIHIGNAEKLLPTLPNHFDVGILCDVIEHFDKKPGRELLELLLDTCGIVIVTTPLVFTPQSAAFENEAEIHRSHWSWLDFKKTHFISVIAGQCLAVCASRNPLPKHISKTARSSWQATVQSTGQTMVRRARYWMHDNLPAPIKKPIKQVLRFTGLIDKDKNPPL